jgi:CDP-glycerol glycerophosphotransferase
MMHHPTLQSLETRQDGTSLEVSLSCRVGVRLLGVSVAARGGEGGTLWSQDLEPTSPARVSVPLEEVGAAADDLFLTIVRAPRPGAPAVALLDLVLTLEADEPDDTVVVGRAEYRGVPARHTAVSASRPVEVSGGVITPYLRRGGNISLAYARVEPPVAGSGKVTRVKASDDGWEIHGRVETRSHALTDGELVFVTRRTGERITLRTELHPAVPVDQPAEDRVTRFTAWLEPGDLLGHFDRPEFLDAVLVARVAHHEQPAEIRVRQVAKTLRLAMPASVMSDGTHAGEFRAYRTFKSGALALEFRPLDVEAVELARTPVRSGVQLRWQTRHRPVWLVGERPDTAQDTGIALYRHLRENHPEIDARYVIAADSPDRDALGDDPGVLVFGSREHVEATLAARRILSSHHSDYLLATRNPSFQRNVRARRIFLQHGVMGTKNMVANYGWSAPGFSADAFVVSSERERRMIVEDFGWPEDRVVVTGLSRHDRLFEDHPPPERRLLIMPTWRDWLQGPEDVVASDFFRRWEEVLHAPEFWDFLERHDLSADLYLHANMQPYADLFDLSHVSVVRHGEVAIQDLLLRSTMMLTDFTSAAIDFSFLDRPVVYYQFDRTRFIGKRPSHFDLDEELPGEIVATRDEVLEELEAAAARGFTITPEARRKSETLLAHRDTGARERIVQAAAEAPHRRLDPPGLRDAVGSAQRLWTRQTTRGRVGAVKRRLRQPLGRALFKVASRLPRSGLVAFESNIGNDIGDSPGALHREIVRRGLPVETAFVLEPSLPAPDGVRVLPRGTLRHLWAMGRARVWVSNQNMPALVPRPPGTFWVQTWHGTPLKRMLHDLDSVVGRDAGYVGRVDRMIGDWSVLLSPSGWATERFRSAFRYDGDVIEEGYPRNDVLVTSPEERARAVRRRLGLARSKKVLVYAPTFRDDQRTGNRFTFVLPLDLDALLRLAGDEYEVLVRLHPVVRGKVPLPWGVHETGAGFEMDDLLAVADVLVTDYSSVMFDYSVLERPMVFYVPDLDHYRDALRGFYLDFEAEAPGPLVRTTAELAEVILDEERLAGHADAVRAFRERFAPLDDGSASARVVDELQRRGVLPRDPR